jgi:alkyl hydroperoxide reductase subunit D
MSVALNESITNLLIDLQVNTEENFPLLERLSAVDQRYLKDLKINVNNALNAEAFTKKEAYLIAYASAVNEKNSLLTNSFEKLAIAEGATEAEIAEIVACVSLLSVNNVFYRFRHFMQKEYYDTTPAGIKMSIMMNPVIGKEFFELVSLVISALNGCELCVKSHEESVLKHGSNQARVYAAVKLGAIIKGLITVLQ